jgi:CxxC-x17-CxxC domain-containing protein
MQACRQALHIIHEVRLTMTANELAIPNSLEILPFLPKNIICIECKTNFVFSAGEQGFFLSRGLSNEPKRCPHCRVLMRMRREGKPVDVVTQVNCIICGDKTTVPFLPRDQKKILCATCYKARGFKRNTNLSEKNAISQIVANNCIHSGGIS